MSKQKASAQPITRRQNRFQGHEIHSIPNSTVRLNLGVCMYVYCISPRISFFAIDRSTERAKTTRRTHHLPYSCSPFHSNSPLSPFATPARSPPPCRNNYLMAAKQSNEINKLSKVIRSSANEIKWLAPDELFQCLPPCLPPIHPIAPTRPVTPYHRPVFRQHAPTTVYSRPSSFR